MDLKQIFKNIKNEEKEKSKKLKESIEQDKIQKEKNQDILNKIKIQNAQLKKETKKNIPGKRELFYL